MSIRVQTTLLQARPLSLSRSGLRFLTSIAAGSPRRFDAAASPRNSTETVNEIEKIESELAAAVAKLRERNSNRKALLGGVKPIANSNRNRIAVSEELKNGDHGSDAASSDTTIETPQTVTEDSDDISASAEKNISSKGTETPAKLPKFNPSDVEQAHRNAAYFRVIQRDRASAPQCRAQIRLKWGTEIERRVRMGNPFLSVEDVALTEQEGFGSDNHIESAGDQNQAASSGKPPRRGSSIQKSTDAASLASAQPVNVLSADGKRVLGSGIWSPARRLCVRVFAANDRAEPLDSRFFVQRLQSCLRFRQRYFGANSSRLGNSYRGGNLNGGLSSTGNDEFYRVCHGEGDGLPGITIDQYGREAVVICVTQRDLDCILRHVCQAVEQVLQPKAIFLKLEGRPGAAPTLEVVKRNEDNKSGKHPSGSGDSEFESSNAVSTSGLTGYGSQGSSRNIAGPMQITGSSLIEVRENGVTYLIDLNGHVQRSGWYYDLRALRLYVADKLRPQSVLDLFSYSGGFGLACAVLNVHRGFKRAVCVDISTAVHLSVLAAELNLGCSDAVEAVQEDAVSYMATAVYGQRGKNNGAGENDCDAQLGGDDLSSEVESESLLSGADSENSVTQSRPGSEQFLEPLPEHQRPKFDCVVLDPPNLCPTKDLKPKAEARYKKMVKLASYLATEHLVVTCCSPHLSLEDLLDCVKAGLERSRRAKDARIVYQSYCQDVDFPVNPHVSTTKYLKAVVVAFA